MNASHSHNRHRPGTRPALGLTLLGLVLAVAQPGHAEKVAADPAQEPERPAAGAAPRLLSLSLRPRAVTLRGQNASQQFLLTGTYSDGVERDLSRQGRFSLSDPRLAKVDGRGQVVAQSDGLARLTAEFGGRSVEADIRIRASAETRSPSFALDLEGIFTRQGCNDSHCHGSVKGRGGFKLSSQAGNPREDHRWILRGGTFQIYSPESAGPETPRIRPEAPGKSLLLLKPTLQMPHGGGQRLDPGGPEYQALLQWIGRGAPYGNGDPVIEHLQVMPRQIVLERDRSQQLVVTAWLSDGSREDFTRRVNYRSTAEEVIEVDADGLIRAREPGEATVLVQAPRQATRVALGVVSRVLAEFPREPPRNFIDEEVWRKLRRLSILPSERSSDHEFLRRVCLDLTGTLPPPRRVREFLDSGDPRKRDQLIATLLNSPEYIDYWTFRLADLFRVSHEQGGREKVKIYWEWIRDTIARNKPFDQVARERMSGQGYNGPTRHLWGADEIRLPQDVMTEQARVFLGRRLDCAQCHDHPFDSWTQDQFWGMTGFFKNLTYFWTTMAAVDDPLGHEEFGADSRLLHPRTKQEVEAVYPDGRPLPVEARADPRPRLADWFTSSDEFLFEEAIVNRFWSYFFGRGIVDPVDDFRLTNPPSHPDLLRKLARYFRSSGYDLRSLIRLIVQSNTYQRSRRPNHTNPGDGANYSRALPRSLDAEILLDMICQITGIPEVFDGKDEREYGGRLPAGTRAMNIVNPDLHPSRFLDIYGRPSRLAVPERKAGASLTQALHMLAGPTYTGKLSGKGGRIDRLLRSAASDREIVEEFYLAALSRFPTLEETGQLVEMVGARPSRKQALEDLLWGVITSREFAYNH